VYTHIARHPNPPPDHLFVSGDQTGEVVPRPDLDQTPMSRQDLFHRRDHTAGDLFATRGCAHRCDFCTLAVMYQSRLRKRPVEAVAQEYASFRGKVISRRHVFVWLDRSSADRMILERFNPDKNQHRESVVKNGIVSPAPSCRSNVDSVVFSPQ
jgi:radical SAM superfamily enzyme YgiQ (UPF0313 family)